MILRPIALGTVIDKHLSRFGITPARIERFFRLPAGGCGCSGRKTALDTWGYAVQYRWILYVGGPTDIGFWSRCRIVKGRLYRAYSKRS